MEPLETVDWDQVYLAQYKRFLSRGIKYLHCFGCKPSECIHKMDVAKMIKNLEEEICRKVRGAGAHG